MQETKERIQTFIEAFEKVYGRKPKLDDAEGNFKLQVAQDMQMSVGGARYYLRLAVAHKEEEATWIIGSGPMPSKQVPQEPKQAHIEKFKGAQIEESLQ